MTKCSQCGQSFSSTVKLCPNDGAVLEHGDSLASHIGEVLDGKYRLDAFLSRGGMGAVYKATHVMLGRAVAVKLINPEYVTSAEAVRRFQREARAATSLNHPNIVSVYDLGQTPEGTLYIAMELVDGPSLKAVITSGGPVAPARTIRLLRQVASALAVAHRHNIVHRDLKPQNIMLARAEDGQEVVKLVDFGIAKTYDEGTELTAFGATMGTPQYMSPEQAAGRTVDGRSDLYSLGVVLYEMLSGEVPFTDKSATAIIIKHMNEAPQPPSLRNPRVNVPADLEATALRCMEKDASRRFQTAEGFVAALESAAAALSVAADAMPATLAPGQPATRRLVETPATATVPAAAADTSPTAIRPPIAAAIVARPASNKAVVGVLVAAILVAGLGAFYLSRLQDPAPAPSASEPPPAVPPSAGQDQPPAVPAGAASAVPASALSQAETSGTRTAPSSAPGSATGGTPASAPAGGPAGVSIGEVVAGRANGLSANQRPTATAVSSGASPGLGAGGSPGSRASAASRDATPRQTAPRDAAAPSQAAPAQFPEHPVVYFHCSGAPEICNALRTAVEEALDSGGLTAVRNPARADIDVAATVEGVDQAVSQQFQTTFAVRTYAIDVSAETTRTNETVSMAPVSNLSFDPQFGSARIAERARLVAADIVERVKAFVNKKRA